MDSYGDIGSLQIRVLRILWERGDGTVHEVLEAFPAADRPAYTTVLNVLRTLERRGLVSHVQQSRQYRYRPLVDSEEVEAGAVHSLLSRIFAGSAHRLVARLLEAAPLDPQELESIQQLIEAREAELEAADGRSG
ncbi:MAG: BlaI/MecI/CopY family transcriptional regulator [Armatimonadota bacterium]